MYLANLVYYWSIYDENGLLVVLLGPESGWKGMAEGTHPCALPTRLLTGRPPRPGERVEGRGRARSKSLTPAHDLRRIRAIVRSEGMVPDVPLAELNSCVMHGSVRGAARRRELQSGSCMDL